MPLAVGTKAPDFELKNQDNQPVRLSDVAARRIVLLVFYPLAFTGTCRGELAEIQDNLAQYANDRVQVLTVSVDSVYSHKVWAQREGYDFALLADFWPHGQVARDYQIFNDTKGYANRGTFIIDREGVIRFAEMLDPGQARDQAGWRTALAGLTR